eukprot:2481294-Rhodomonas_salina.1
MVQLVFVPGIVHGLLGGAGGGRAGDVLLLTFLAPVGMLLYTQVLYAAGTASRTERAMCGGRVVAAVGRRGYGLRMQVLVGARSSLRAAYAMSSTDVCVGAYGMRGTEIRVGPTGCA